MTDPQDTDPGQGEGLDVEDYGKQIGQRIVEARRALNMRQVELGELLGVAERTMQAYESGEVIPHRRMRDLERILGRPMAWFLHGESAVNMRDKQLDELHEELHKAVAGADVRNGLLVEIRDTLRLVLNELQRS